MPEAREAKANGRDYKISVRVQIPLDLGTDRAFRMYFKVAISAAYGVGQQTDFSMMWRAVPNDSDPSGIAYTETDYTFDSGESLPVIADGIWKTYVFEIEHGDLVGNEGGELECIFYVIDTSTGPSWYLNQEAWIFPRISGGGTTGISAVA